jgi:hypothetical protein
MEAAPARPTIMACPENECQTRLGAAIKSPVRGWRSAVIGPTW